MRYYFILLINIIERCTFIFFYKEASNLILRVHSHGLPAKVYFCGVHFSFYENIFFSLKLGYFFGGKAAAATRSFWIIFGRVATAAENA